MKKINILCANGLEECEALLIHDLLSRAQFEVKLVNTMEQDEVISSHNLTFKTDVKLSEADHDVDAIFLPGGIKGSQNLRDNQKVKELILKAHQAQKLICAICAAPDILAQFGIVQDLEFTCYPGCDYHKKASTANIMIKDNVITAKALGASFELAYEMIKALSDEEKAKSVINQVYYSL